MRAKVWRAACWVGAACCIYSMGEHWWRGQWWDGLAWLSCVIWTLHRCPECR